MADDKKELGEIEAEFSTSAFEALEVSEDEEWKAVPLHRSCESDEGG